MAAGSGQGQRDRTRVPHTLLPHPCAVSIRHLPAMHTPGLSDLSEQVAWFGLVAGLSGTPGAPPQAACHEFV